MKKLETLTRLCPSLSLTAVALPLAGAHIATTYGVPIAFVLAEFMGDMQLALSLVFAARNGGSGGGDLSPQLVNEQWL